MCPVRPALQKEMRGNVNQFRPWMPYYFQNGSRRNDRHISHLRMSTISRRSSANKVCSATARRRLADYVLNPSLMTRSSSDALSAKLKPCSGPMSGPAEPSRITLLSILQIGPLCYSRYIGERSRPTKEVKRKSSISSLRSRQFQRVVARGGSRMDMLLKGSQSPMILLITWPM